MLQDWEESGAIPSTGVALLFFFFFNFQGVEFLKFILDSFNYYLITLYFSWGCCCSVTLVRLFLTPWTAACQASLSFIISQSLLRLMSFESMMPSSHLICCHPLFLLPSLFPSIRVFSNGLTLCIRWPKYWTFSFSISPSNEYSGLISSRINWSYVLAIQGTLKSLLQHHSSKA